MGCVFFFFAQKMFYAFSFCSYSWKNEKQKKEKPDVEEFNDTRYLKQRDRYRKIAEMLLVERS